MKRLVREVELKSAMLDELANEFWECRPEQRNLLAEELLDRVVAHLEQHHPEVRLT